MRALVIVSAVMIGCASASATPLSPEGPPSESQPVTRNKVAQASEPAPQKASAVEPVRAVAPVAVAAPSATSETAANVPSPKGASTVKLLSAGAEPRQELRYVFHRGESTRFRSRTTMTMDTVVSAPSIEAMAAPRTSHQPMPTTECSGTTVTRAVDANGTAHRDGWLDGVKVLPTPGVDPTIQSKVEEMLRGVGKTSFGDVIDTRGQISESHADLSAVSDPTVLQTMRQMSASMSGVAVPWPLEAVGAGAKWQVDSKFGEHQQFTRTIVVTLSALRGKQLQLDLVTTVVGAPGQVKNGIGVGQTDTSGTAHLDVTLDPLTSQSQAITHASTKTITNGVHMEMKIDTAVEFHSGP